MEKQKNGISIKKVNYIIAFVTLIISIILFVVTIMTSSIYNDVQQTTQNHINGENDAHMMQEASDYLTEEVRSFAETGELQYLNNYFTEVEVNLRREKALRELASLSTDPEIYNALVSALNESVDLMNREYYSMRLTAEAYGHDISKLPQQVQDVVLLDEDKDLSSNEKADKAREMVFDDIYHGKKEQISLNTHKCLEKLVQSIEQKQQETTTRFGVMINTQRVLIVLLILVVIAIIVITSSQVIIPLVNAIPEIRDDKPIPIKGASEFRFLAKTYNRIYEENKDKNAQLAYEASHDQLTGVYNRKGFERLMQKADFQAVALMLIDVDHFKSVNDNYGHEIGDKLLAKLSSTIKSVFRSADTLCRVGGDEFVLFMFKTGPQDKNLIRDRIEMLNKELSQASDDIPATSISVGVVFGNDQTGETLYKCADEALYYVKNNGRHGCAFFDDINKH